MAIKNYMINDKWLDIAKQNIVEVESTDGVIGSVKVNGEEYGGGGGSSDFSTAEVTISNESGTTIPVIYIQNVIEENALSEGSPAGIINAVYNIGSTASIQIPLYKGGALWAIGDELLDYEISVSGSATKVASAIYHITGDCTIIISVE